MRKTASCQVLSTMLVKGFFSVVVAGAFALSAEAKTIYVAMDGDDSKNGETEVVDGALVTNAVKTVKRAVALAAAGDVIEIGAGTYEISADRIEVKKAITLKGAVNSDGTPATEIKNTYLGLTSGNRDDGNDKNAQIMRIEPPQNTSVAVESIIFSDGYVWVKNASSNTAGKNAYRGAVSVNGDAKFKNCVFQGSRSCGDNVHSVGLCLEGGTYVNDTYNTVVENCIIRNNYNRQGNDTYFGGGIYIDKALVKNCVISNNVSRGPGGGIGVSSSGNARVQDCLIVGNFGDFTIGSQCDNSSTTNHVWKAITPDDLIEGNGAGAGAVWGRGKCELVNCLIAGNYSCRGSEGISASRCTGGIVSEAKLYGCTVIDNVWDSRNNADTSTKYCGGLYNCSEVGNTIVWNNIMSNTTKSEAATLSNYDTTSGNKMSNCCTSPAVGAFKIEDDPEFADYTFTSGVFNGFSWPCEPGNEALIDKGDNAYTGGATTDIAGQNRVLNLNPVPGCLEVERTTAIFVCVVTDTSSTHNSISCTVAVSGLAAGKTVGLTLDATTNATFSAGAEIHNSTTATLDANGLTTLTVTGLELGKTYRLRIRYRLSDAAADAEDETVDAGTFETKERPFHVNDDLTIDERGVTIVIDEVYGDTELVVTLKVNGVIVSTKTVTAETAGADHKLQYKPEGFDVNSVIDVICCATVDGIEYSQSFEVGRILYVRGGFGNDANDGKTLDRAKATLAGALAAARLNPRIERIQIAAGEYQLSEANNAIVIDCSVTVEPLDGAVRYFDTVDLRSVDSAHTNGIFTIKHSDAVVRNIEFKGRRSENTVRETRRAVRLIDGTLENCEIHAFNVGGKYDGAGVLMEGGFLRNCLIYDNDVGTSKKGSGVSMTGGAMENCTVVANIVSVNTPAVYAGVDAAKGTHATIVNAVIYGNNYNNIDSVSTPNNLFVAEGASVTYTSVVPLVEGEGNSDDTLQFENGYHLKDCTAVNSGTVLDWMTGATDLDGNPRVDGFSVDRGCYEKVGATAVSVDFSPSSGVLIKGASQTFTAFVGGVDTEGLTYIWNFGDGTPVVETTNPVITHDFPLGKWKVSLTVKNAADEVIGTKMTGNNAFSMYGDAIYVSVDGSETFPYDSWENAAKTIATAVDNSADGLEILVAPGSYPESVSIKKAVTLRSSDPRNPAEITSAEDANASLLYIDHSGVTVRDLSFSNSRYADKRTVSLNKSCVMENCVITNNLGGGVDVYSGSVLRNCLVADNSTEKAWNAAGVYVNGAGSRVENCIVRGNVGVTNLTYSGGGIYATDRATVINTLVYGNVHSNSCGGVVLENSSVLENCTVVDNTAGKSGEGVGVYLKNSNCAVRNCVIVGNRLTEGEGATDFRTSNSGNIYNTCYDVASGTVPADKGNFVRDAAMPLFADWANGDYHLAASSQLRDKGISLDWHTGAVDLDGKTRVARKAVDIGCYEDQPGGMLIIVK